MLGVSTYKVHMTLISDVRQYLSSLPPLSVTTSRRIYEAVQVSNPNSNYDYLRAAVQRIALGSSRLDGQRTRTVHAIYLELEEMRYANLRENVYLSLNGVEREFIENMTSGYIKSIKSRLGRTYGSNEAIRYWVQSTQLNSMSRIKKREKDLVKQRENDRCRVCTAIEDVFTQSGGNIPSQVAQNLNKGKLKVCHIVSRSSIFWHLLAKVDDEHLNIFTDGGVQRFKFLLENNSLHSSSSYMALLCHKHDRVVQSALVAS